MVNAKTGERLKGELQGREEPVVSVRRRFLCCRLIDAVTSKPLQGDNGLSICGWIGRRRRSAEESG